MKHNWETRAITQNNTDISTLLTEECEPSPAITKLLKFFLVPPPGTC